MEGFFAQFVDLSMDSSSSPGTQTSNIFDAASRGNISVFKDLVEKPGSDACITEAILSARNSNGETVLHHAASAGRTEVCKYLVEKGKLDVNCKGWKSKISPLHLAVSSGIVPTAVFLIENGADLKAVTAHRRRTPLHSAVEKGSRELVELLLSKGAEINVEADCGTPLHYAANEGKKDIVKILLDNHADPNLLSRYLTSPLLAAIGAPSVECVKLLLEAGADPNLRCAKGMTPLCCAADKGQIKILEMLIKAGADPNITEGSGMTPLEVAVYNANCQCAVALFKVTSRIPNISDWSIDGVVKRVQTLDADRMKKLKEAFLLSKSKGTEAVKNKDYHGAVKFYTEAMFFDLTDATVYSNRSLCYMHLNDGQFALEDALACIKLKPDWSKAHYRAGAARMLLKEFEKAADDFKQGLKFDPKSRELKVALREAEEAQQNRSCWFPNCDVNGTHVC